MTQPVGKQHTIYDVAKTVGVSPRTVSRYFNDPDKIAKKTRAHIETVVNDLQFRPNAFANRMSRQDRLMTGVMVCTASEREFKHTYRDIISHAGLELARHRRDLLLLVVDPENEDTVIHENFRQRKMDGLFIMGEPSQKIINELAQCSFPKVSFLRTPLPDMPMHARIGADEQDAFADMTELLIQKGYRRIAYLQTMEHQLRFPEHLLGAQKAVDQHADVTLIVLEEHGTLEGADRILDQLNEFNPRPDLILCQGDIIAISLLHAAQTRGLSIPDDLAIAGFDGLELLDYIRPAITTVEVPNAAIAQKAMDILLNWSQHVHENGQTFTVPTTLRLGDTT